MLIVEDMMRDLTPEQDARGTHVVADVDQQNSEVANAPQQTSEHNEAAHLAE